MFGLTIWVILLMLEVGNFLKKNQLLDNYRFGHDYVFSSLELRKLSN